MSVVVAIHSGVTVRAVTDAATALADLLGATVRHEEFADSGDLAAATARAVALLDEPEVAAAALSFAPHNRELVWAVLARARKPVVVVPAGRSRAPAVVARALVPLEATAVSAAAIEGTLDLLAEAGVDIVVLHVLDPALAPPFWDHPGHAAAAWTTEFLARFCRRRPDVRMTVRSGDAETGIADVARDERVDLVALAWSQHLDPGRARIVRSALRSVGVPVLLVPAPDVLGPNAPAPECPGNVAIDP